MVPVLNFPPNSFLNIVEHCFRRFILKRNVTEWALNYLLVILGHMTHIGLKLIVTCLITKTIWELNGNIQNESRMFKNKKTSKVHNIHTTKPGLMSDHKNTRLFACLATT